MRPRNCDRKKEKLKVESDVDLPDHPSQLGSSNHHCSYTHLCCFWPKPQCRQVHPDSLIFQSLESVQKSETLYPLSSAADFILQNSREKIYAWIIELSSPETREAALLELSKKREVAMGFN